MSAIRARQAYRDNSAYLEDELRRLDLLIRLRALTLALQNRAAPEAQAARTLYITPQEVTWLLDTRGAPASQEGAAPEVRAALSDLETEIAARVEASLQAGRFLALPQLCSLFGLSALERGVLVVCLAPELRRKYDRLYAYLQDDITRQRPSVDLALELLCESEVDRWQARSVLLDSAPLLRAGLIAKVPDPHSPSGSSGLAEFLRLDARICGFLLGHQALDARLAGLAQLQRASASDAPPALAPAIVTGVLNLIEHHLAPDNPDRRKLIVYLHGPQGVGKGDLARHVSARLGAALLRVDVQALLAQEPATAAGGARDLLRLAFREGLLQQAALYLERADALLAEPARPLLKALALDIREYGWLVLMGGETPWTLHEAFPDSLFQPVALPVPDVPLRTAVWERSLTGLAPEAASWAAQLAARFRLTPGQVRAAVELAQNRVCMELDPRALTLAEVAAACRQQSHTRLGDLAAKIEPHYGWDDIVLPEDKIAHLREICSQVRHQYHVLGAWGFGKKLSHGKGLSVLFSGPSGTGKTMAAEVLAHDLELDLYKVDLSGVVSKYIGETEKNLARIFSEAETSNAILFFDEADALFGKRTEVSDAHDRYANIETSYLLQRMEDYEGVVILATNLRGNMDEAFTRRIRFIVEFPFPDEASRLRIWQTHFPREAPVSEAVDYVLLSRRLQIAGGNIKNIVLNSAFLAAQDGGVIGMEHILRGAKREFEKIGKLWVEVPPAP